jgi:transcriptional regulator with XRE-family HTH domain
MSINERIREVRNATGLSQAKFSTRMAISSSYLADIELNNKPATERIIRLLSTEFNVDDNWLRTGEGTMFNAEMDVQVAKIISLFKSLNQQFKGCALNQMEELADLHGQLKLNQ